VSIRDVPTVDLESSVRVRPLGHGMFRVVASYGFMQPPDVPAALEVAASQDSQGIPIDSDTTYYLAHLTLFATDRIGMARWRDNLFIVLARNARRATNFFRIPADCVVEIGIQLEL
jgi:KUP system potassium uptake protein